MSPMQIRWARLDRALKFGKKWGGGAGGRGEAKKIKKSGGGGKASHASPKEKIKKTAQANTLRHKSHTAPGSEEIDLLLNLAGNLTGDRDLAEGTQTPSRGAVCRVRRGAWEEGGGAWALGAGGTPRGFGGSGASASKPTVRKGPPYLCCVCSKAFIHPPAHSSHERAHMLQSARVLALNPILQDATCMEMESPTDAAYDDMMDQVP
jgi:hypothetical protein